MIKLGKYNILKVVKTVDFGVYLDGGEYWGEILLPWGENAPKEAKEGDELEVFIYFDSEDRIIATMNRPKAVVGDFALLKVVGTSKVGAFLDWGLRKDLLVPFREQREDMVVGKEYLVYVYVDQVTDRIVASSKWHKFLNQEPVDYEEGQEVELLIARRTDLGYNVIVDGKHEAVIYQNEIFQSLTVGERVTGYIKNLREDGKIDCILQKNDGHLQVDRLSQLILTKLEENNGVLAVSDKSAPEEIYRLFGCSKKNYKKAVGGLFKQRRVEIGEHELKLIQR
ncbi:S1-like domain-containing RNA-binding protein [uncultured Sanguibacteroides sp.]|uniref:CvfB family protein n=1 Tax=uncultured Sanguibacteroides sp. TaxID=1635151 RepID=UPI0025F86D61|nr:S1-like domain-containing RNA-binding protein [uncultured Sanguibacteroides sp.]